MRYYIEREDLVAEHAITNEDIETNLAVLLLRVNCLLGYMYQHYPFVMPAEEYIQVHEGFTPSTSRSSTEVAGSAVHMIGAAVDLVDQDNKLSRFLMEEAAAKRNASILAKFKLRMMHPDYNEGLIHLDTRPIGTNRVFRP